MHMVVALLGSSWFGRNGSTLVYTIINTRTTLLQLFTGELVAHVVEHGNS